MYQFTEREIEGFRRRNDRGDMERLLEKECEEVLRHDTGDIPAEGIANWGHYYTCPECSVQLVFNLALPTEHVCPSCGRVFRGEPYDGAWYRLLNDFYSRGADRLALLWLLSDREDCRQKAQEILLRYARYYPSYKIHGDIPYNHPGKANAQTLDEAFFLVYLAYAYDIIRESLGGEERSIIEKNLFREGLDFLWSQRMPEIHNHEVIVGSAIGVLSLLLGDKESLERIIHTKYGLLWQLDHGTLSDGMWFECSIGYHFYAIEAFFLYEKFACTTSYALISHPSFRRMFECVFRYLKEDLSFPLINDMKHDQGSIGAYDIFEFAYARLGDSRILAFLQKIYQTRPRLSDESFFHGVPVLPVDSTPISFAPYIAKGGCGMSVLRGGKGEYLLLRHGPYGGEHDHYDRLGISYTFAGIPVSEDFGTCAYGGPYHYGWFKHTGTHNTVTVGEENQAPNEGRLEYYRKMGDWEEIAAISVWDGTYTMPDTYTIVQWSEEAYRGVAMRRVIRHKPGIIIDVFTVRGVSKGESVDFVMHFHGKETGGQGDTNPIGCLSKKEPFSFLEHVRLCSPVPHCLSYRNGNVLSNYFSMDTGNSVYLATGKDNPTDGSCPFFIERCRKGDSLFMHVLACGKGKSPVDDVLWHLEGKKLSVILCQDEKKDIEVFFL